MNIRLFIEDVNTNEEDYLSDMIYQVIDKIVIEENKRKMDSIIIKYQNGEETEIR